MCARLVRFRHRLHVALKATFHAERFPRVRTRKARLSVAPPTRSRKPVLLSEWAVARTPFPGPWLGRARRRLHRDLFRLADEESMLNGQHERLLHGVVR